jgi:hypothetical protein
MFSIRSGFLGLLASTAVVFAVPAMAGSIALSWDPTPGATGYNVYYGTQPGNYNSAPVTTSSTSTTVNGLQDCTTYYLAVKAFNQLGESEEFSNELSGWSRPGITSATPSSAMQGDQIVMDVMGANFLPGAIVDLGNPHVTLTSVTRISCNQIQLMATVEPTGPSLRAARIGPLDLTVANPDSVFGIKSQAFEVLINPARFDINQSDPTTTDRIDGKDTVYLSRMFGTNESDPNFDADDDFDGDGWIDGQDLAYIASNLGRCWSAATNSWSLAACPTALQ